MERKLAIVHWIDATAHSAKPLKEVISNPHKEIISIGYLAHEDEHSIILCYFCDLTSGEENDFIAIPKGWIKRIIYVGTIKMEEGKKDASASLEVEEISDSMVSQAHL